MTFHLILDAWIPVTTSDGERLIAPAEIANPSVLGLAAPRPDFNGALLQFLIGLLQTACAPPDEDHWRDWLQHPPSKEKLEKLFSPLSDAFNLDGDGPKFMQDFSPLTGDTKPVSTLLIDAPGAQALRLNTDHFIKRDGVKKLCTSCAATALFTLQTNAPAGGAGHRTSLRGGGPLSTLVALDTQQQALEDTLWRRCWLNVLTIDEAKALSGNPELNTMESFFPWMGKTRTSKNKGDITTPQDAHPMQMFWGMPRRILLHWQHGSAVECDLCGAPTNSYCEEYTTQNYGINYEGAWQHPLSPHSTNKDGVLLPQHAQPGGMNYGYWLGLITAHDNHTPAQVVTTFVESNGEGRIPGAALRLHAFGYDMDNMKARCWYESTFPLFNLDESIRDAFVESTSQLIEAANHTAGITRGCIKDAWFKRPGDAKGDTTFLLEAFFSRTHADFFEHLQSLKALLSTGEADMPVREAWHRILCQAATGLFDYWTSRGDFESINPRRIAAAHNSLIKQLYGKKLRQTILNLPTRKEQAA